MIFLLISGTQSFWSVAQYRVVKNKGLSCSNNETVLGGERDIVPFHAYSRTYYNNFFNKCHNASFLSPTSKTISSNLPPSNLPSTKHTSTPPHQLNPYPPLGNHATPLPSPLTIRHPPHRLHQRWPVAYSTKFKNVSFSGGTYYPIELRLGYGNACEEG